MDLDLETVKARVEADGEHVKKQERAFVLYAQRWWDEVSSACMLAIGMRAICHPYMFQTRSHRGARRLS